MENIEESSSSAGKAQYDKDIYELKLYVVGNNKKSQLAFNNLKEICHKFLAGRCHIEVIDLKENPGLARVDQIIAIPTLIRKNYPGRIIGDLSNHEGVLRMLDVHIPKLMDFVSGKRPLGENSLEHSKTNIMKEKRSKDNDLQPYIGSDLHSGNSKAWINRFFHYNLS
ncbi:MAG: circadian clock KaiB family protein [Methanosarcina sp.]